MTGSSYVLTDTMQHVCKVNAAQRTYSADKDEHVSANCTLTKTMFLDVWRGMRWFDSWVLMRNTFGTQLDFEHNVSLCSVSTSNDGPILFQILNRLS